MEMDNTLIITSEDFENGGILPKKCTSFGEDLSPQFTIGNLPKAAMSLSIIMDDIDAPIKGELNHWLIWNIKRTNVIPGSIPEGEVVKLLGNAVQGIGYGKNKYRGPHQPFFIRGEHRYKFTIYALDTFIMLKSNGRKADLLNAMYGHVIKEGTMIGRYKR